MKLASIRVIHLYLALLLAGTSKYVAGQPVLPGVHKSTGGAGWAQNSINAVSFRKNAITSHGPWQFTAYYNAAGQVVLARRRGLRKPWQVVVTSLKGQVADAHNNISLAIDGAGYLHLAWNHHNTPLQYTRSLQPYALSLAAPSPMTGMLENRVTYPQFYRLPNGQLIFMYRHGQSGNGQLVINRYNPATQHWQQLHQNL
ncbi:MAG TPA: BNR-4 repeat-containing protein, partial [Phnomibacter sp.]|nr:BNR-4 repeat-containing protein [Phnomibacter sp.]